MEPLARGSVTRREKYGPSGTWGYGFDVEKHGSGQAAKEGGPAIRQVINDDVVNMEGHKTEF
jgi:hypothetical protein